MPSKTSSILTPETPIPSEPAHFNAVIRSHYIIVQNAHRNRRRIQYSRKLCSWKSHHRGSAVRHVLGSHSMRAASQSSQTTPTIQREITTMLTHSTARSIPSRDFTLLTLSVSLGPHHMTALQEWLRCPTTFELRSHTCTYTEHYTHTWDHILLPLSLAYRCCTWFRFFAHGSRTCFKCGISQELRNSRNISTAALDASITKGNIQGGLRGAGLVPFDPKAVKSKLEVRL
jgi:hypothetical protein